jgi:sulfhydrogenase subunit gamma (sulfur reductase)
MARPAEALPNPYRPSLLRIEAVRDETLDVRTLSLGFLDAGECVFAISNAPWRRAAAGPVPPAVECTFRAVGKVTGALRALSRGAVVGFRGPYGNHFRVDDWRGKDLAFLGGGIGMAALRSALLEVLSRRSEFGEVLVLNGARTAADLVYVDEMAAWAGVDGVRVVRTVDPGGEGQSWNGEVGVVFESLDLSPGDRVVVACGPPIMLRYLFEALDRMGYRRGQVVTTLENKMKCGIGHCGRCNVGPFSVCRDGPVVTWAQLEALPRDY